MRMRFALVGLTLVLAAGTARGQEAAPAAGDGYAWTAACQECHADIYDAWAKTKHAKTFDRLNSDERKTPCAACHVTGPKQAIDVEGKIVNANVGCESCHGAGAAHIQSARAGSGKGPIKHGADQALCETCHNDKSPHYRGFFYGALVGLVHKTK